MYIRYYQVARKQLDAYCILAVTSNISTQKMALPA